MLSSTGVQIIGRLSEDTFGRWSYNGFSTGPFNLKGTRGKWGRRAINDFLPSFLAWSIIIL